MPTEVSKMNLDSIYSGSPKSQDYPASDESASGVVTPKPTPKYSDFAQLTAAAKAFVAKTKAAEESGDNGIGGILNLGA